MNHIKKIPTFQRKKSIPKQLKDLELRPLNEQFSKLTMPIISDDDMRPAMMGNFFDMESKKIVSTDAHKLASINMPKDTFNFIAQKYNKELNENPKGLIFHTLKQLQTDYNELVKIGGSEQVGLQPFDEFVEKRIIEDGNYPNYEAVIPKEFTNEINVDYQKLYWYSKVLLDAKLIDDVNKLNSSNENEYQNKKIEYLKDSYVSFINPNTHQIILTYTLDGKKEYIGFNAKFLCDILKFTLEYKGKTFGQVGLSGNSRAMVIEFENGLYSPNDSIGLIMPVMLSDNKTIGAMDYNNDVLMYYDLDTNSIISDGVNYPIDESIGFIPLRDFLPTPKIKPNLDMPNDSMSLIDTRIKGLIIALKVAKAENKAKIEKRIKGLEIAKKVQNNDNVGQKMYKIEETKNTIKYEDLLQQDRDIQSEIDIEKRKPKNEQSELKRLALEREVISRKIDEMEKFTKGGGVGFKERSERDSLEIANLYSILLKNNFDDETYEKYKKLVKKTQIPKEDLDKIEFYISTTPKAERRMIDTYQYWGINKMSKGGVVFTNYNGSEIMYEPNYDEYFVNDEVFYSMEDAKNYIDSGESENDRYGEGGNVGDSDVDSEEVYIKFMNKDKAYKQETKNFKSYAEAVKWGRENLDNFNSDMINYKFNKGGRVGKENYEMLKNKTIELLHHSKELQAVVKKKPKTPAWVISKSSRASTDLSDITHYLEGKL